MNHYQITYAINDRFGMARITARSEAEARAEFRTTRGDRPILTITSCPVNGSRSA